MSAARVIYHLARADFLERVRRYSFLIMLGLAAFLSYQTAVGNVTMRLDQYRGEFNSAWVGSMMALISSFFLGWFGFYLVKGSVARDRETGVGQIMATTPLTRPLYTFGKWVSNFAVLLAMNIVLALAGIGIQFLAGENMQLNLAALLAPFLFITLPVMALVAAVAVLFESIGFLSGGFGNVVYFFLFVFIFPLADNLSKTNPALEPLGLGLIQQSTSVAAKAAFPEYDGGFVLGDPSVAEGLGFDLDPASYIFQWNGIDWTPDIVIKRFALFGLAVVLALAASIFFDRFDPSRRRPRKRKGSASLSTPEPVTTSQSLSQPIHLTPLTASRNNFAFIRVLISELKLLLKGQRWWWYAVAIGLFIASLVNTPENVRTFVLPFTWLWPILIWSGMGNREIRHNAHQMVFSSAAPLLRQLPATWLAGFLVTVLTGSGVALKLFGAGDTVGLLAWFSAAIFIPSFALALGVWSNSHKLFEVLYVTMWYLGPLNKVFPVDYLGANSDGNIGVFIPCSIALIVLAFIGRARQLQN
ncbi:MAG TPA: ABC transporter permease subunit [Anaerolineales bacterium]|nr:ABC transporter permease subunit [Anaerolineales bacterium]